MAIPKVECPECENLDCDCESINSSDSDYNVEDMLEALQYKVAQLPQTAAVREIKHILDLLTDEVLLLLEA